MGVYDGIIEGLKEALEHAEGKRKLRSNKASIAPLKDFSPEDIKGIRKTLGLSQVVFAGAIGVSPKTVEAWESGKNKPKGPARRILTVAQTNPDVLTRFVNRA